MESGGGTRRSGVGRARAFLLSLALGFGSGAPAFAEPVRVASLLPFVGEALALIPEHALLVAAARRDLHTPPQPGLVDLGNPHSPDLEGLAAAHPAVVVGDRGIHGRLEADLARGGVRVVLLDTTSVDATLEGLATFGEELGDGGALRRRGDAFRARLAELRLAKPVAVLPLFGTPDSFFVVTGRAWLGDLLGKLGFELPAPSEAGSERFPGLVPVSDELLVTLRPELVVLVAHGDPAVLRESLERKTAPGGAWSAVGRSASLGVRVLPPDLFGSNPGLGMERAAEALVALAAPAAERAP